MEEIEIRIFATLCGMAMVELGVLLYWMLYKLRYVNRV